MHCCCLHYTSNPRNEQLSAGDLDLATDIKPDHVIEPLFNLGQALKVLPLVIILLQLEDPLLLGRLQLPVHFLVLFAFLGLVVLVPGPVQFFDGLETLLVQLADGLLLRFGMVD